ncbi:MAG: 50S ribosomal protein L9 [Actinobacteria bacterium]|nr:MAG: 50S ribosomal protein L9 [Actinomycetota bacterium]
MKIILTQEVRNIGAPGDVVDVADGYARNYLIPRGVALRATKGTLKQVDTIRRTREVREIRNLEQAQQIAEQLAVLKIRVQAKAGDGGRLFGQVTPAQIAEAVAKAGGPKIDKKRLHLDEPVKSLGAHRAHLRLHPEVEAEIEIEVLRA